MNRAVLPLVVLLVLLPSRMFAQDLDPAPPAPAASAAATPVSLGHWRLPSMVHGDQTVKTSIGRLSVHDLPYDHNPPSSVLTLNGVRLKLGDAVSDEGRFDAGALAIERVLDFGDGIDLVYESGGCIPSRCDRGRSVVQLDGSGHARSPVVEALREDEERPDTMPTDVSKEWSVREGLHVMVLGIHGDRVRELQLSSQTVQVVERAPLNDGEWARLTAQVKRNQRQGCEALYETVDKCAIAAPEHACSELDPKDPGAFSVLMLPMESHSIFEYLHDNPYYHPFYRPTAFAQDCHQACVHRKSIDKKTFEREVCPGL
jgi:hypothetical protein